MVSVNIPRIAPLETTKHPLHRASRSVLGQPCKSQCRSHRHPFVLLEQMHSGVTLVFTDSQQWFPAVIRRVISVGKAGHPPRKDHGTTSFRVLYV